MSSKVQTIANMYDREIANNYDLDKFQLLTDSYSIIIKQIQNHIEEDKIKTILDLALGTGTVLTELKNIFPQATLSGIDISQEMLAIAKEKMVVNTFHDDAKNVGKYIAIDSIDLILVHFLFAYVAPEAIIAETAKTLKPGGFCSIATSTYQSFLVLQKLASQFLTSEEVNMAQVPQNPDALIGLLTSFNFKIVETKILKKKVIFTNFKEAYAWGMNSGWFTQYLMHLSSEKLDTISASKDIFPLKDEFQATIILAQKIQR